MTPEQLATSRECSVCGRVKPLTAFPVGAPRCKTCKRNGWVPANFLDADPIEPKPRSLKFGAPPWRYPLTVHQHRLLRDAQRGRCAICGNDDGRLMEDHRHDNNGYVRGLLCSPCNQGLGLFRDHPERLRAAADYVERPILPGPGCADLAYELLRK